MPERTFTYHVLRFADEHQATELTFRLLEIVERAFAARAPGADDVVVWTSSPWAPDRELYLSDAAYQLAQSSGFTLRADREISRADLPPARALLIDHSDRRA